MTVRLSSDAQSEIATSAHFYLKESLNAATNFLEEIDEAVRLIGRQPTLYPIHADEVRVKHLDRFPFSLFFQIDTNDIYVLSAAHNARRPDYWKSRH